MTQKEKTKHFDNTGKHLRHWCIIQMPFGETRVPDEVPSKAYINAVVTFGLGINSSTGVQGKMGPISHLNYLQNVKGKVSICRAREHCKKEQHSSNGQLPSPFWLILSTIPVYQYNYHWGQFRPSGSHWPSAVINATFHTCWNVRNSYFFQVGNALEQIPGNIFQPLVSWHVVMWCQVNNALQHYIQHNTFLNYLKR